MKKIILIIALIGFVSSCVQESSKNIDKPVTEIQEKEQQEQKKEQGDVNSLTAEEEDIIESLLLGGE